MTDEQYENLMYSQCAIIALLKKLASPSPVPGISWEVVITNYEKRLHDETTEIYNTITGTKPEQNRKKETDSKKIEKDTKAEESFEKCFEGGRKS